MSPTRLVLLLAFWLSVFNISCAECRKFSKDVLPLPNSCTNCSLCPYPCRPPTPPAPLYCYPAYGGATLPPQLIGNPLCGTPPPPCGPLGYPANGGPPSPLNSTAFPVQCCHYPPPYYQPYENRSMSYSPPAFISLMLLVLSIRCFNIGLHA